jgi:hypothetical protein
MAATAPPYAQPESIRGEQCTRGAFSRADDGGRQRGVVADVAKLSVGREK